MSEVTGPISTMPGTSHNLPNGTMCDYHPDVPAVARIQGETDSFGSELNDMCQECIDEQRKHRDEARSGRCDWCKEEATDLCTRRDFEEGPRGPIYQVCGVCIKKENDYWASEYGDDMRL